MTAPSNSGAEGGCTVNTLAELRERPELLQPPTALVPRLAWRSRVVLLAGEPKGGKTTLLAAGAAVLSRGGYLFGDFVNVGRVLWLSSDGEALGDLVARFGRFRAEPANVDVVTQWDGTPSAFLAKVYERRPELVVIDTLSTFASLIVQDFNNAAQWVALLSQIKRSATDTGAAVVLIHHVNKSTGRYRDSSHLGAAVDAILEMQPAEDGTSIRKIRARARWSVEPFTFHLEGDELELVDSAALTLDARVLLFLRDNPGTSTTRLRSAMGGKAADCDTAIHALERRGAVVNRGDDRARRWCVPEVVAGHRETGPDRVGTESGQGEPLVLPLDPCPAPIGGGQGQGDRGGSGDPDRCAVCGSEELSWIAGAWRCEACALASERAA